MQIVTVFLSMLVIFALLVGLGFSTYIAMHYATDGQLTPDEIAGLPFSSHAMRSHAEQYLNAPSIQTLMNKGVCSPKVLFFGCSRQTVLFACKAVPDKDLYGVLVIGLRDNWSPVIVTGFAVHSRYLERTARNKGCKLPGVWMP
jgi:hypothetical protein